MNPGYIYWKNWCWSYSSNTLATWWEELTQGKTPKCWETLRAGERDDRGWDGWMASVTRWTCVGVIPGNWWWTGKPGMLQSMGSKSWTPLSGWTELNWTETITCVILWVLYYFFFLWLCSSTQTIKHYVSIVFYLFCVSLCFMFVSFLNDVLKAI